MIDATSLAFAPLLAWGAILGLGIAAALLLGFAAWRRARGVTWRALAALALLAVLANPYLVREQREPLPDIALIAIDESASNAIEPRPAQVDRAMDALDRELAELANTEVRVIRAGRGRDGPAQAGTKLFGDIERALAEIPRARLAGVVVLSDGQIHDVPEGLEALGVDAPIHHLVTGREGEGDRRLTVGEVPGYGIVGREVSFTVTVEDLSAEAPGSGRTARLELRREGAEPLTRQVPVGEASEVTFPIDHRGKNVLELRVAEGPEELTLVNNRAAVVINGVRDRLRVLLVSGEPHAGERAWRRLLKSDPSVDLVHFTILRPPSKQDGTPIRELSLIAFPTRELFEVKIDEFDLIVFDRYKRRGVLPSLYLDNVARYVEQGGALLEANGPSFSSSLSLYRTPLGRVLPGAPTGQVFERGFKPEVTDLGRRHPVTADLSQASGPGDTPAWGRWFRQMEVDTIEGDVVMRGVQDRPLLILNRVGDGRVAQLNSDHAWLWGRGFEGGGPQAELMRRVAHWLMKEPDLEEEDLRAEVEDGQLEIVRRSLDQELPEVEVTRPDGSTTTLPLQRAEPGRAVARMPADQLGAYRITDGEMSALAAVGAPNPLEFRDVRSSTAKLAPLVAASDGAHRRIADGDAAVGDLPRLRKVAADRDKAGPGWLGLQANRDYRVAGVAEVPLLPGVLALILALGLLIAAWFREGR
jgi:hypothetical protein